MYSNFFTYTKCERLMEDRSKRIGGVVIDGSAVSILGKLPNFHRITHQMNPVSRVADRQYIMRVAKSRKFIESIMSSVKKPNCHGYFDILLKGGLWYKRHELVQKFFNSSVNELYEFGSVSRFVRCTFEHVSEESLTRNIRDASEENIDCASHDICAGNLIFGHETPLIDLRRKIIDFRRCWCFGSIARGA